MRHPTVAPIDVELDAIAWEFLGSQYGSKRLAGWSIDRRLHAYLLNRGLSNVADSGTSYGALLGRVLANIASALDDGTLRPDA